MGPHTAQVLGMTVDGAAELFKDGPRLKRAFAVLGEVGSGILRRALRERALGPCRFARGTGWPALVWRGLGFSWNDRGGRPRPRGLSERQRRAGRQCARKSSRNRAQVAQLRNVLRERVVLPLERLEHLRRCVLRVPEEQRPADDEPFLHLP